MNDAITFSHLRGLNPFYLLLSI